VLLRYAAAFLIEMRVVISITSRREVNVDWSARDPVTVAF